MLYGELISACFYVYWHVQPEEEKMEKEKKEEKEE